MKGKGNTEVSRAGPGSVSPLQDELCNLRPTPQSHGDPIVGRAWADIHKCSLGDLVETGKEGVQEIGCHVQGEDLASMRVPRKNQVNIWPSLKGSLGSQRLVSQQDGGVVWAAAPQGLHEIHAVA